MSYLHIPIHPKHNPHTVDCPIAGLLPIPGEDYAPHVHTGVPWPVGFPKNGTDVTKSFCILSDQTGEALAQITSRMIDLNEFLKDNPSTDWQDFLKKSHARNLYRDLTLWLKALLDLYQFDLRPWNNVFTFPLNGTYRFTAVQRGQMPKALHGSVFFQSDLVTGTPLNFTIQASSSALMTDETTEESSSSSYEADSSSSIPL